MTPQEALRQKQQGEQTKARDNFYTPDGAAQGAESRLSALYAEIVALPDDAGPIDSPADRAALLPKIKLAAGPQWFMVIDLVSFVAGFLLAWGGAALLNYIFHNRSFTEWSWVFVEPRLIQFMGIAAALVLWFENTGHYRTRMPFWIEAQRVVSVMGIALMADTFFLFATKQDTSRFGLIFAWAFAGFFVLAGRGLLRAGFRRVGLWQIKTLLVGNGPLADEARHALQTEPALGYDITAQVEDLPQVLAACGGSWQMLCARHGIEHVLIALDGQDLDKAGPAIAQLMRDNIPFSIAPPMGQMPVLGMMPQHFFNYNLMLLTRSSGLEQPLPRIIKRSMDLVVSTTTLVLLSPVFVALALWVKCDGGPAFFSQPRVGMNGKVFPCLKFRSMKANSDVLLEKLLATDEAARREYEKFHKLKKDPRVTFAGSIMRRTSLDELPQVVNVLLGQMSLVGPRPIMVEEKALRGSDIAYYLRVRPGITGLWQVSGRNEVSFKQRIQMESWYVRNWSLWNDIAIILKTFPVLWNSKGAY